MLQNKKVSLDIAIHLLQRLLTSFYVYICNELRGSILKYSAIRTVTKSLPAYL